MVIVVLLLAVGFPIAAALGDRLFVSRRVSADRCPPRDPAGAVLLAVAVTRPTSQPLFFEITLGLAALFMPFAGPNAVATIYDVTEPEVRSTLMR